MNTAPSTLSYQANEKKKLTKLQKEYENYKTNELAYSDMVYFLNDLDLEYLTFSENSDITEARLKYIEVLKL